MNIELAERMRGIDRTLIRRIFDAAPADAINLGLGQPDLPTPSVAALAGVRAIAEGRTAYTSTAGAAELREAIAARYDGFAEGPANVVVTVGTQEAMFAACLALLDPGSELLVPDPGYPAYPVLARLLGARPVAYPLRADRRFRLDPDDVIARLTAATRAVILCAPSNPTGACPDPEDLRALTAALERRGVPWISDEIYSGFLYDRTLVSPASLAPRGGLVISGVSKDASMTGWRIGWVVGPEPVASRIVAAHQYLVTCAPSPSQHAALAALSPAGRAACEAYRRRFAERREIMAEELGRVPRIRFDPPDGAFYFFVDVSDHGESLALARRILDARRVITIPGEAFGENGVGWLRLSFACEAAAIREGVRRIAAELAAGPGGARV